jgi:hypothetical protein
VLIRVTFSIFLLTDPQHLNSLHAIQERLLSKYNALPLRPWNLDHRLLRSTPASPSDKSPPRYQHLLHLSYRQKSAFAIVSPPTEAKAGTRDTVVTVRNEEYESFYALLKDRFAALWTPRAHQLINGSAFTVGEFTVRLGEMRQAGSAQVRGLVCCIEASSGIGEGITFQTPEEIKTADEVARADMASLWERIGHSGPILKEAFTPTSASNPSEEGFNEVRTWCDLLKPGT